MTSKGIISRYQTRIFCSEALLKWKSQIFEYQHYVRENKPPQQTALFDLTPKHCDPDQIDPQGRLQIPCSIKFFHGTLNPGDINFFLEEFLKSLNCLE
ncbi:hypothetical protein [Nostoc sp.]|uniref:hypothetical protein n=1 Tax=Nostoc sp. TaxID=1180 RepID=UPI002FF96237